MNTEVPEDGAQGSPEPAAPLEVGPRRSLRTVPRLLLLLAAIQIGLPLLMVVARNKLIFFPWSRPAPEAGLRELSPVMQADLVRIPRADGRTLAAYDVRPKRLSPEEEAALPTVVFFHGNAGNIAIRASRIGWFADGLRARVILFDYSGYGGNEGSPSEDEVYTDGLAVVDWLAAEGVDPSGVVLYGESLGGAVAAYVASERECAGLVLQSTFPSLSAMALSAYWYLPLGALFVRGSFPTGERVADLTCPVLVAHGSDDRIIPISLGRKLHAAARAGTEFLPVDGAGHNDFFEIAGAAYLDDLATRLRTWTRDR